MERKGGCGMCGYLEQPTMRELNVEGRHVESSEETSRVWKSASSAGNADDGWGGE